MTDCVQTAMKKEYTVNHIQDSIEINLIIMLKLPFCHIDIGKISPLRSKRRLSRRFLEDFCQQQSTQEEGT